MEICVSKFRKVLWEISQKFCKISHDLIGNRLRGLLMSLKVITILSLLELEISIDSALQVCSTIQFKVFNQLHDHCKLASTLLRSDLQASHLAALRKKALALKRPAHKQLNWAREQMQCVRQYPKLGTLHVC